MSSSRPQFFHAPSGPRRPRRSRRLATPAVLSAAVLSAAVLSAAVLASVTGCTSSSGSGPASPSAAGTGPEQPDITVAAVQSVTAAGLYIAAQKGYFTDAGLHVTITSAVGSSAAIPDLAANRVQVVFGNYVSDILAQAHGAASLRFLAAGNVAGPHEQEVVVLPGSPITTSAGLRGKTIGVNALNNVGTLMIQAVLAKYGVASSAARFVDIPFPSVAAALAAHQIDAAYISDPFLTAARQKYGVRTLFDCDQGTVANFPISGYVSTSAWAARNPRTVAAFVRALERGQALADGDRAAMDAALTAYTGIPAKTGSVVSVGTYPVSQQVQAAPLQRVADLMLQFGLLKHPFSVASMTR